MNARTLALALAVGAGAAVLALPGRADAQGAAEAKLAREMLVEATKEEKAGRCNDAIEILKQVVALKENGDVHMRLGDCRAKLGMLVEAAASYAKAESLATKEPAVKKALPAKIAALKERTPTLTVKLGPTASGASVKVDGEPFTSLDAPTPINPGEHTVEATGSSGTFKKSLKLEEKDTTEVVVEFESSATGGSSSAPVGERDDIPEPVAPSAGKSIPLGTWVAGGAGLLLAGGGVVSFVAAGNAAASGREDCATKASCDPGKASTVHTLDTLALGLWVAAGVGVGVAITLYVIEKPKAPASAALPSAIRSLRAPSAKADASSPRRAGGSERREIAVRAAPFGLSLAGRF